MNVDAIESHECMLTGFVTCHMLKNVGKPYRICHKNHGFFLFVRVTMTMSFGVCQIIFLLFVVAFPPRAAYLFRV